MFEIKFLLERSWLTQNCDRFVLFCIVLAVHTLAPFPIFTEGRRGLYTGYILTVTDTVKPR